MHGTDINRREFVRGALAGLALGANVRAEQKDDGSGLPRRPLGRGGATDLRVRWHCNAGEK